MDTVEKITDWIVIIIPAIIFLIYFVGWLKELKDNPHETIRTSICIILYILCIVVGVANLRLISQVENWFFRIVLAIYGMISFYTLFNWLQKHLH